MSIDNTAGESRIYGEARADLISLPEGEVTIDLLAYAGPDWGVDGNTAFMDRLAQLFAALNLATELRTVVLGPAMQWELTNGGVLGSRNIVYSPEREPPKQTGLRLMYVDGVRGLARSLRHLRVPHAWVIGDAATYAYLVPYCRRAYIVPDDQCSTSGQTMPALQGTAGWQHERTFGRICGCGRRSAMLKYVNSRWLRLEDERSTGYGHYDSV